MKRKVKWSNEYINTLGIDIGNSDEVLKQNFTKVIAKLRTVSKMWYYRQMSLIGKILIVNTMMASLFVYKMQVLPLLREVNIKLVDDIITDLIWNGKHVKIPLKTLKISKDNGGYGLVDIKAKHQALLFTWISDCRNPQILNLAQAFLGKSVQEGVVWNFNLNKKDSKTVFGCKSFWHQLANQWHEYSHYDPQSGDKVRNQYVSSTPT